MTARGWGTLIQEGRLCRERGHPPEAGGRELTVVAPDPAAILPEILRSLPVRVERVEVHAPSLEDVFLKLTGRQLEGGPKA